MESIPYITFASNYLVEHFGGKINIVNNTIYIENSMDEFYCSLNPIDKTEKNKFRFWHRVKGQQEYHRQIDRKVLLLGCIPVLITIINIQIFHTIDKSVLKYKKKLLKNGKPIKIKIK